MEKKDSGTIGKVIHHVDASDFRSTFIIAMRFEILFVISIGIVLVYWPQVSLPWIERHITC